MHLGSARCAEQEEDEEEEEEEDDDEEEEEEEEEEAWPATFPEGTGKGGAGGMDSMRIGSMGLKKKLVSRRSEGCGGGFWRPGPGAKA